MDHLCNWCNFGLHLIFMQPYVRDDVSSKHARNERDFTVDLIWWGTLRLAPISRLATPVTQYWCFHFLKFSTVGYYNLLQLGNLLDRYCLIVIAVRSALPISCILRCLLVIVNWRIFVNPIRHWHDNIDWRGQSTILQGVYSIDCSIDTGAWSIYDCSISAHNFYGRLYCKR